jgi:hypothetical protein
MEMEMARDELTPARAEEIEAWLRSLQERGFFGRPWKYAGLSKDGRSYILLKPESLTVVSDDKWARISTGVGCARLERCEAYSMMLQGLEPGDVFEVVRAEGFKTITHLLEKGNLLFAGCMPVRDC